MVNTCDETNSYEYIGAVDYVFVGTVTEIIKNIVPDEPGGPDEDLSVYEIHVDKNLKSELVENIEYSKHGGLTLSEFFDNRP